MPVEAECLAPDNRAGKTALEISALASAAWGFPVREEFLHGLYRRYSGDLVALGKWEILEWERC